MNKFLFLSFLLAVTGCINKYNPPEMVYIEKGTFFMGNNNGSENEKPAHDVTLTRSFYMSKYEITYSIYDIYCTKTNTDKSTDRGWGRDNRPVVHVNWFNAIKFCNWLSKNEKLKECYTRKIINNKEVWFCDFNAEGYRLPTEAEWEYAARGGSKSKEFKYSGSNKPDDVSWYSNNSDMMTHPVGMKKPNELGLYDMSGNVYEWCWDAYYDDFYKKTPLKNPMMNTGRNRVKRGGSWKSSLIGLKNTFRNSDFPNPDWAYDIGFRVVRTAK